MRALALAPIMIVVMLAAGAAAAQDIDGAKPLRCALANAAECDDAAGCEGVDVELLDLPETIDVDFAAKHLISPETNRTSPITALETLGQVLVLQGHQNQRGWTMVIERATGRFSAAVADVDGAFVISGGCSAKP